MAEQTLLGGRRKGGPFMFYLLLILAAAALGLAIYHYFTGSERVMPWQPEAELYPVSATLSQFSDLFQTFKVPITGFLVSERFDVGLPVLRPELAGWYLGILCGALIIYFTVVSTFTRLPYIVAMTLAILFLATFNFDLLRVTKENSQVYLILVLGTLVLVSYAFQAFFTQASRWVRLAVFTALVLALTLFLGTRSGYSPTLAAMLVVHYNSLGSLVAACLFIFLVSFENIHALLWINTQSPRPERRFGLWHFGLIGLLYLLNLLLLYLNNAGIYQFDFYYVDAFIVLLLSTVAGFWGWQRREGQYRQFFTFKNGASYLYLVLAIICFLNIGYAFATYNTPLISAYTDVIVYTHLAYGFLFFLYILLNFWQLIKQKLAVYKVVFDPKQIPFFTVYIMGTLLLMSLVFRTNFIIYNQAQAGYYNYLGDFYKTAADPLLAERFYTEGAVFSHHNLKSTYALAGIYRERSYITAEINLLRDALAGRPHEKIYARMAGTQTDKKDFFNHLFLLNQGLRTFLNSVALLNNKALLYETATLSDSTEYFYNQALAQGGNYENLVQSNLLAFHVRSGNPPGAVALAEQASNKNQSVPWQSNLALLNLLLQKRNTNLKPPVLPAKTLSPAEFSLFYHFTLQHIGAADAATIKQINQYLAVPENVPYAENLNLLKALTQYNTGQVKEARNTLENQALVSESATGFYYYLIGSWLLEQKLYPAAASYFDKARAANLPEAQLPYLYALAHTPDKNTALSGALAAAAELKDPAEKAQALFLADVLNLTNTSVLTASDSAKVAYLEIYRSELSTAEFETVTKAVTAGPFKGLAYRELAAHYIQTNNLPAASQTIQAALAVAAGDKNLQADLNILRADLLVRQGDLVALNKLLPALTFDPPAQTQKIYYQALAAEKTNPSGARAQYSQIPQSLIYREDALLATARYYSRVRRNDNQAYEVLLSGIKYNPFSVRLYQEYIFTSVKLGLSDFAETAVAELKNLVSPAEYALFRTQYEQKLKEKQDAFPGWD